MKKSIIILIFCCLSNSTNAQSLQIGIGLGSTIVNRHEFYTNDLSGIVYRRYVSPPYSISRLQGLGFNSEYNLNIKFRLFLKSSSFNLYSDLIFNRLVGKGTVCIVPLPTSSYAPPPQKSESKCNIFNCCLGVEYQILKEGLIPYLSGGIMISHLGDINIQSIKDENINYVCKVINGGVRYGLEFGIGFYFKVYKNIFIDISSKYAMNNLISRKAFEERMDTIITNINLLFEL